MTDKELAEKYEEKIDYIEVNDVCWLRSRKK